MRSRRRAPEAVSDLPSSLCVAAGVVLASALVVAVDRDRDRAACVLAGAGLPVAQGIYLLLGRSDRRHRRLRHEMAVLAACSAAGAAAPGRALRSGGRRSLAAAWIAHAAWDAFHHRDRAGLRVALAYPPFCAGFDVALAGLLVLRPLHRKPARRSGRTRDST